MMSESLFGEFEPVSAKQWKQKIQFDLKGKDYNETLLWESPEDIHVKPFYHSDDLEQIPPSSGTKATQWNICQEIYVASVTQANTKALNALNRGADSILFILPVEAVSVYHLLKNIRLSETTVYFRLLFLSESFIVRLKDYLRHKDAKAFLNIDLIGNLAQTGNWYTNLRDDHAKLESIMAHSDAFKGVLGVNLALYQNAGASMVQQLAYGLAHANEYLNHFYADTADKERKVPDLNFTVAVGTNYFFEIAKIRALRNLWEVLANVYHIDANCNIHVIPTKRNKTLYDYNTNMLRTTTECMSAILGGANTISNLPYDAIYHKDNEFGERIARNQLLILKKESYFDKVDNPADGAYYIETLTDQLTGKALKLFKEIEKQGGFLDQLKKGTIQRKIKENAKKEQTRFEMGEEVLLGTNKHPNQADKMKNDLELYPFMKTDVRKTLIEPIIPTRLAEQIEQQRLKTED